MGGVAVILCVLLASLRARALGSSPWQVDLVDADVASAGEESYPRRGLARGAGTDAWFEQMDAELGHLNALAAAVSWRLATQPGPHIAGLARSLAERRATWRQRRCAEAPSVSLDASRRRQLFLLCRGSAYTPSQARALAEVSGRLEQIYASSRVCRRHGEACYSGEPDLERLMRRSRDPAELLWAWQQWRRTVGPPSRQPFLLAVELQNLGAANNGYSDMGEVWREELETPHLEMLVEQLYAQVQPLYELLHAYVRHRLVQYYGDQLVDPRGPIPAHLLGNMWAQSWDALSDLVGSNQSLDLTAALLRRNYSVWDMVRRAEDFYTSLGLEPMTPGFWSGSRVGPQQPGRGSATCHGTAANMFLPGDYRMLLCADVTAEDFYIIHHEMGHIEYYMTYRDQPAIFQDGANSAFQEAVGDAIMYGVLAPQHLLRLGLLTDEREAFSSEMGMALLLHHALAKIPQIPFGLLVDKWRWMVFRGDVEPGEYNTAWWLLRSRYQGVTPPVPRAADDFDPAAKFHIPDNTPYVRYFLASFLQMQMFKAMCEAATLGRVGSSGHLPFPLHQCDIYGSKDAGKYLRAMMSLGSSQSWPEALDTVAGTRDYNTMPLLEYYAPLQDWLLQQVRDNHIYVGW